MVDVGSRAAIQIVGVGAIGQQASALNIEAVRKDRRQSVMCSHADDQFAIGYHEVFGQYNEAAFGVCASALIARSISPRSRTFASVTCRPNAGAANAIARSWPGIAALSGLKRIAMFLTAGATSLSNSSHLPAIENSKLVKPVVLPPGRAKLSTSPLPTGSVTVVNTIGIALVCCCTICDVSVPCERMTSGLCLTKSAAAALAVGSSPPEMRNMSCRLRLWLHPRGASPCARAAR